MADQAAVSTDDGHAVDRDRRNGGGKSPSAFRTISEAAAELDLPQHVLRFWESKFPQIKPMKRGGGRRYYRPEDITALRRIKDLLHVEGYTIKGAQKLLRDPGQRATLKQVEGEGGEDTAAQAASREAPPEVDEPRGSDDAVEAAIVRLSALRDRMRAALGDT